MVRERKIPQYVLDHVMAHHGRLPNLDCTAPWVTLLLWSEVHARKSKKFVADAMDKALKEEKVLERQLEEERRVEEERARLEEQRQIMEAAVDATQAAILDGDNTTAAPSNDASGEDAKEETVQKGTSEAASEDTTAIASNQITPPSAGKPKRRLKPARWGPAGPPTKFLPLPSSCNVAFAKPPPTFAVAAAARRPPPVATSAKPPPAFVFARPPPKVSAGDKPPPPPAAAKPPPKVSARAKPPPPAAAKPPPVAVAKPSPTVVAAAKSPPPVATSAKPPPVAACAKPPPTSIAAVSNETSPTSSQEQQSASQNMLNLVGASGSSAASRPDEAKAEEALDRQCRQSADKAEVLALPRSYHKATARIRSVAGAVNCSTAASQTKPTAPIAIPVIDFDNGDLDSNTWWEVDLSSGVACDELRGATRLLTNFMEKTPYDEEYSRRILEAYNQFLHMVNYKKDWASQNLLPPPLVKQMWDIHRDDMLAYFHDSSLLCCSYLFMPPPVFSAPKPREVRRSNTLSLLHENMPFDHDADIWDYNAIVRTNDGERLGRQPAEKEPEPELEEAPRSEKQAAPEQPLEEEEVVVVETQPTTAAAARPPPPPPKNSPAQTTMATVSAGPETMAVQDQSPVEEVATQEAATATATAVTPPPKTNAPEAAAETPTKRRSRKRRVQSSKKSEAPKSAAAPTSTRKNAPEETAEAESSKETDAPKSSAAPGRNNAPKGTAEAESSKKSNAPKSTAATGRKNAKTPKGTAKAPKKRPPKADKPEQSFDELTAAQKKIVMAAAVGNVVMKGRKRLGQTKETTGNPVASAMASEDASQKKASKSKNPTQAGTKNTPTQKAPRQRGSIEKAASPQAPAPTSSTKRAPEDPTDLSKESDGNGQPKISLATFARMAEIYRAKQQRATTVHKRKAPPNASTNQSSANKSPKRAAREAVVAETKTTPTKKRKPQHSNGGNKKQKTTNQPASPERTEQMGGVPPQNMQDDDVKLALGCTFKKNFGEHGIFTGTVTALPTEEHPYFKVRYSDGDKEEMSEEELLRFVPHSRSKKMNARKEEGGTSVGSGKDVGTPTKKRRESEGPNKAQLPALEPSTRQEDEGKPEAIAANVDGEPKKRRGKPQKTQAATPKKRGPGRPRKNSIPVDAKQAENVHHGKTTKKRGPGRPRKSESNQEPKKRGPGRPRKTPKKDDEEEENIFEVTIIEGARPRKKTNRFSPTEFDGSSKPKKELVEPPKLDGNPEVGTTKDGGDLKADEPVKRQNKVAKTARLTVESPPKHEDDGKPAVGTTFQKKFIGHGYFTGRVTELPTKEHSYFKVRYEEDGDEEDLSEEQLLRLLKKKRVQK